MNYTSSFVYAYVEEADTVMFMSEAFSELYYNGILSARVAAFHVGLRDAPDVAVYREEPTGTLFLDRNVYSTGSYSNRLDTLAAAKTPDTLRRAKWLRPVVAGAHWADIGTGAGGIVASLYDDAKAVYAIDPIRCIPKALINKWGNVVQAATMDAIPEPVEVITLFHVLEHIDNPLEFLLQCNKTLKPGGKIYIEVPHGNDFLIHNCKEFRNHTFWSEHKVLYTEDSLRKLMEKTRFTKLKFTYIQRYGLDNHMGWLTGNKGTDPKLSFLGLSNSNYAKLLIDAKQSDTIMVSACRPSNADKPTKNKSPA